MDTMRYLRAVLVFAVLIAAPALVPCGTCDP